MNHSTPILTACTIGLLITALRAESREPMTVGSHPGCSPAIAQAPPAAAANDRNAEVDAAIGRLRGLGAFVREFHPRNDPRYWVQVISTGLGEETRRTSENFDDAALADVATIARGVELDLHLRETSVTAVGLEKLTSVKKISTLQLAGRNVDDALLKILPRLPLQGRLGLESDLLTDEGIKAVGDCRQLTSISITGAKLTDECLGHLLGMPALEGMFLGANFTPAALPILARVERLRDLDVAWQTPLQLSELRLFPNLRKVSLSGLQQDDRTALMIATSFKSLEQAYLRNTSMTNIGVQRLARMDKLTVLTLDGAPIDDGAADSIRQMKQLKWLSLEDCAVGDATLAAISECPELWYLSLSNTRITAKGLADLARLKKLKAIYLSSCPGVTDDGIEHLARLPAPDPNTLNLNIQGTGITEQGARRLQEALPNANIVWGVPAVPLRAK